MSILLLYLISMINIESDLKKLNEYISSTDINVVNHSGTMYVLNGFKHNPGDYALISTNNDDTKWWFATYYDNKVQQQVEVDRIEDVIGWLKLVVAGDESLVYED